MSQIFLVLGKELGRWSRELTQPLTSKKREGKYIFRLDVTEFYGIPESGVPGAF
jgi:hypothetical protein